ncbi:hypothetical protein [Paenibacillus ginsengarvi]|uniref:DUF5011 domain-containing protein n=1 Tax=Paenibacillus ginsengarvi TaxID=400777 RepID=A0A3B0C7P7_9BACL|nr:hypothetical protein [Paenibacillus ginsengarvi]RKN82022.1 hypothetical protein D7M11_18790 [Paenibacillus ginsengarvi]
MSKKSVSSKWISAGLIFILVATLLPVWPGYVAFAADDETIYVGGAKIGNASNGGGDNAFINFNGGSGFQAAPGFEVTDRSGGIDLYPNGTMTAPTNDWAGASFKITVQDNPKLKELAASGEGEIVVGWEELEYDSGLFWTAITSAVFKVDGETVLSGHSGGGTIGYKEATASIKADSVIDIGVSVEDKDVIITGLFIKFQDTVRPELKNYTFTGTGVEQKNKKYEPELYAKQGEDVSLALNFSEPVRPRAFNSAYNDHFLRHPFFTTPAGDGLPTQGQEQFLVNKTYTAANFAGSYTNIPLHKDITYTYTASKYHHSGNLPVRPRMKASDALPGINRGPLDLSLEEKLQGADFIDGAGNRIKPILFPLVGTEDSQKFARGGDDEERKNPFDAYRVIIDAVAPKYSKVGNGIQPEIVTGATVNGKDVLDFTVQFSEDVVPRDDRNGSPYAPGGMYLLFNNGMRAYYYAGDDNDNLGYNTKNVRFRMVVPDGVTVEVPLLKVLALTHDWKDAAYPADSQYLNKDKNVIQDYAGNLLIQPANYYGIHVDGDTSNVNSKIDWAKLSVDNTKPLIGFHYESDGATDAVYKQRGKITIDADDPAVKVPVIDPEYDAAANFERPSRGIYRPFNMSGPASPAIGLVYYTWTRSVDDPLASVPLDHYAAVKRYSLTAKQPREDLYDGKAAFANLNLNVANNKTNMIAPPAEAYTSEGSGTWYLHAWTADMTWDTARELMQYEKMKKFKTDNSTQYEAWKQEVSGSEADKIIYADSKALAAVGQYDDLDLWLLKDFKQPDSNWTHEVAAMQLDNKAPTIKVTGMSGSNSANVEMTAMITDEHSGLRDAYYQWVQVGRTPVDVQWKPVVLSGSQFTTASRNEVAEDGDYVLYIKATDKLGNTSTATSEQVKVNSAAQVTLDWTELTDNEYIQSRDIVLGLNKPEPLTVKSVTYSVYTPGVTGATYGNMMLFSAIPYQVSYAFSYSSARPDAASYALLGGTTAVGGGYEYVVPANRALNGTQYLHVTVKEAANERYYYFNKAYYFDNQPPTVQFSLEEDLYPRAKHTVAFAVSDALNTKGLVSKYQWVKKGAAAPDASSTLWKELIENETAPSIDAADLAPGEAQEYKLYVHARDKAGNETVVSTTGHFRVSKPVIQPPADARSDLLYVFGDQTDGYTAIVQLGLDVLDKNGYEYSVSPDYGQSWLRWRSYTNFIAVQVPSANVQNGQIQVRYKTGPQLDGSEGTIGEAKPLNVTSVSASEPVYALATLSTERPVTAISGVDIDIAVPLGIKVVPSAVNPSAPTRTGNRFRVTQNGYYSFELTDTANPDHKNTLYAVVSNVDSTPPTAVIERILSVQAAENTAGNISVKLKPSEPVRITNNNGSATYTFKQNGTFTFEFLDEAGNSGTASFTETNIDKEGPKVQITRSYTKADGTEYARIATNAGELIEGVRLTVEKESATSEEFTVADGKPATIYMKENGVAEFTVLDSQNNRTTVKETINNIVNTPPQADTIQYTLVDVDGNPQPDSAKVVVDGKTYAKGKMKVEIAGQATMPNRVVLGTAPYKADPAAERYDNEISAADGSFSATRLFSADGTVTIAISDLLGNINRIPVTIEGLDNKAPELTLHTATVGVAQNKPDFDFRKDLGGYTVRDNVSAPEHIQVTVSGLDLTRLGRQTVTYTAVDQVGNKATATQEVFVIGGDGMLIYGNDTLVSAASAETAIFETNAVSFRITGFNEMEVAGQKQTNEKGTYDLYYYSGLFREGQMKTIATKLTYGELASGNYEVIFPKTGWYTIIVRNQERDREYASFFISQMK